uniref:Uncharacterized protein n=1 Tax=Romanomermis culicivorax TaxID=13658 RepID=A0A915L032_ROMCU
MNLFNIRSMPGQPLSIHLVSASLKRWLVPETSRWSPSQTKLKTPKTPYPSNYGFILTATVSNTASELTKSFKQAVGLWLETLTPIPAQQKNNEILTRVHIINPNINPKRSSERRNFTPVFNQILPKIQCDNERQKLRSQKVKFRAIM